MSTPSAIGIMDPAFFVGKNAILKWSNDFFGLGYNKIEQFASGAAHCQVLDAVFPGKVPLHKVNFHAKYDYEFVKNYKILQAVFDKEGITKHVDVNKLCKAKYQDNLEFCQWMKHFFETRYTGQEYNAIERRNQAQRKYGNAHKHSGRARSDMKRRAAPSNRNSSAAPAAGAKQTAAKSNPARSARAGRPTRTTVNNTNSTSRVGRARTNQQKENQRPGYAASKNIVQMKENEIKSLNNQIASLRLTVEGLEKERNFYFGKLRDLEILCQTNDTCSSESVLQVLYHTDDNDEFQAPPDSDDTAAATESTEDGLEDLVQSKVSNDDVTTSGQDAVAEAAAAGVDF